MNGTPAENLDWGLALASQSIADGVTVNGPRIVFPSQTGKHLSLIVLGVPGAGVTDAVVKLQGTNDGGTTWTTLKKNDGVTDLAFTAVDFAKTTGKYDGKPAFGSIDVTRSKYKDYRVVVTPTGGAFVVGVVYIISPVERRATHVQYPAGQNQYGQTTASGGNVDELLNAFLPTGS